MSSISKTSRESLGSRLYHLLPPSPLFLRHPFKIYEFGEMLRVARVKTTETVLDLGCGMGRQSTFLARHAAHVHGVDPSPEMIARAEAVVAKSGAQNITLKCARLEQAGFQDGFFDAAYSFSVIEHVQGLATLFREVFRVLKPGGRFVVSTDALGQIRDPTVIERHNANCSVITLFSESSLNKMFHDAGLDSIRIHPICTGSFAAREFAWAEEHNHAYKLIPGLLISARLRWLDLIRPGHDGGIFLIGIGKKPEGTR